jgi:5-methylcytosine-specific restriction endonuclease McrA
MRSVLDRPTLVLNRSWLPVGVTPVARALVMVWNDVARVVETEEYRLCSWDEWAARPSPPGDPCIRGWTLRMRVPEVLCLARYDRSPGQAVTFSRRNVAKRDHHTCQYCGAQPGWGEITVDHVLPRSQGGASTWTNCVAACVRCNARKADRTPDQAGMRLRKHPTRPEWKPCYAAHSERLESWSRFLADQPVLAAT